MAIDEYAEHCTATLTILATRSRHVECVSDTPVGPVADSETVAAMNHDLDRCNQAAARCAPTAGVPFIDVWTPFTETAHVLAHHQHAEASENRAHG
ncbi:hypothetical protein [Streptomyces sp. NPDC090445]|uniref:hypothetical protein n=1 Tax=Streptomyces sp. NPDC090445 TaxID=3365963 RepID=UPI003820EDDB